MDVSEPLVAVVVPTTNRPDLLTRALSSVLSQSHAELDVIVVVDGPDARTADALEEIQDDRMRTIHLPESVGPGRARNAGVEAARADWIAFLDDDDVWLPGKLERQLATAASMTGRRRIVTGRVLARGGGAHAPVWPRRFPGPNEPLSEYLFSRRGLFWGEALIQTSTWLVEATLFDGLLFGNCRKHEDLDWLLRADREKQASIEFVPGPDPIAVWSVDPDRTRASTESGWRESADWARQNRSLFTERAYASFLLTLVSAQARQDSDRGAFSELAHEAFTAGRPRVRDLLLHAGIWLDPRRRPSGA